MTAPHTTSKSQADTGQASVSPAVKQPRGLRNNNPGNIRHGASWQGLADVQSDPEFCTFKAPEWGIRAIARILLTYEKNGFDTVEEIISRWAPYTENNTAAFIEHACDVLDVKADVMIDVDKVEVLLPLVKVIITHECGFNPYSDGTLMTGLKLAGVSDAPSSSLPKKLTGKVLTGAGVGLGLVSQAAGPAKQVADSLGAFTAAPIIQTIVTVALTCAGIAVMASIAKAWIDHRKGFA